MTTLYIQLGVDTRRSQRGLVQPAVIYFELIHQGQTADLSQGHTGEDQTVLGLQFLHLRFAAFGSHFEQIRLGSHTFVHRLIDIALQLYEQVVILICEFFLMLHGNDSPISLVHLADDLIVFSVRTETR